MNDKTIHQLSVDARLIYERLSTANPGDVVTYEELSQTIGIPSQQRPKAHLIVTARRKSQRDDGKVFAAITNVGLKCMTDSEIATSGEVDRKKIRSASKRGIKRISCVKDFGALSNEDKIAHNTSMSMLGAIHQGVSYQSMKRLENVIKDTSEALPLAKTLELFGK